jgi:hypothetical protein
MSEFQNYIDSHLQHLIARQKEVLGSLLDRIDTAYGAIIQCEEGWWPIIKELDDALAKLDPHYEVQQIKEKFGGLRYYCSLSEDVSDDVARAFYDLIETAEKKAAHTCENCGKPGFMTSSNSGWLKTLCPECTPAGYKVYPHKDDK